MTEDRTIICDKIKQPHCGNDFINKKNFFFTIHFIHSVFFCLLLLFLLYICSIVLTFFPLLLRLFVLDVNMMLRMIAVKAASKPQVEISQDGETLSIKTSTTVRTTHITFTVGQEFNETTVDGRPCTVRTA